MAVEGFLGRWSRRKREAERETVREPARGAAPEAGHGTDVAAPVPDGRVAADPQAAARPAAPELRGLPPDAPVAGVADVPAPQPGVDVAAPEGAVAEQPVGPGAAPRAADGRAAGTALTDVLPDISSLTGESDFSPFMRPGVDPKLRVAALKRLFSDPRFNQMDGLDVYIDDYGKPDPLPPGMLQRLEQGRSLGLFRGEDDPAEIAAAGDAVDGSPASADSVGERFAEAGDERRAEAGDQGDTEAGDERRTEAGDESRAEAGAAGDNAPLAAPGEQSETVAAEESGTGNEPVDDAGEAAQAAGAAVGARSADGVAPAGGRAQPARTGAA